MAFLKKIGRSRNITPHIAYGRVRLRAPRLSDYSQWADLRHASQDFLRPWEPAWAENELSRAAFRRRVLFYNSEWQNGTSYPLFIFARLGKGDDSGRLVGGMTLSNVRRGAVQSCTLGYWMGAPFAGQGLMSEAVRAVIPFIFDELALHRIEAACIPENTASRRLLENAGFRREGLARRYLKINGVWQDHLLYALLADDTRPSSRHNR